MREPRPDRERAAQEAAREALFLVCLALDQSVAAAETCERAVPWFGALVWQSQALLAGAGLGGEVCDATCGWPAWRAMASAIITSLETADAARRLVEQEYFAGHPVLFPDLQAELEAQRNNVREFVRSTEGLVDLDAVLGRASSMASALAPAGAAHVDLDVLRASAEERAALRAATLVDSARATAYELLGERPAALPILERQLQACVARLTRSAAAA
jgi:hypothetical protein